MANLDKHFYHKTITTYTSVIGTLFNNIYIKRSDKDIKVPLLFAGQQKENNRIKENEDPNDVRYKTVLPVLSFEFNGLERDEERIKNPRYQLSSYQGNDDYGIQYNRIPFIFSYTVRARTKHIDDMLQIIEQVMVTLEPSVQVVVKDNPDLKDDSAITINLDNVEFNNQYEGVYEESRELTSTFSLSLEGYLYKPTEAGGAVIKKIFINYWDLDNQDEMLDQTIITPENQHEFD